MVFSIILGVLLTVAPEPEEILQTSQFEQMVRGSHSKLRDVEFVCEGTESTRTQGIFQPSMKFQSMYAFRSDGSVHWEIYEHALNRLYPLKRIINSLLSKEGIWNQLVIVPDMPKGQIVPVQRQGTAASLAYSGSPGRFIFEYLWNDFILNPKNSWWLRNVARRVVTAIPPSARHDRSAPPPSPGFAWSARLRNP